MSWGFHLKDSAHFPGNILELKRSINTGLPVGFYYNGYSVGRKAPVDSKINIKGFHYKMRHSLERIMHLMQEFGIEWPVHKLSRHYLSKEEKQKVKEIFSRSLVGVPVVECNYAKYVEKRDLSKNQIGYSSDLLVLALKNREDLKNMHATDKDLKKIQKDINRLKIQKACNSITNNRIWAEGIDGKCRNERLLCVSADTISNTDGGVIGHFVTSRVEKGRYIFTIREFCNVDDQFVLRFKYVGDVIVPAGKHYGGNNKLFVSRQLLDPNFIKLLNVAFQARKEQGETGILDFENQTDVFNYLAVYDEIKKVTQGDEIESVDYLLYDNSYEKY